MLVEIEFTSTAPQQEVIDLVDYGFDAETSWNDLTSDEQNEILDSLCEQYDVVAGGEEIPYKNNEHIYEESYEEEDLEIIKSK
jgi:hypothetical protein